MIAGPYRSGSNDPGVWEENLKQMNQFAHAVFLKGHTPVIGVNMALPIIQEVGEEHYDALMMPISLALTEVCDAILRIGGPSSGADQEVEQFQKRGQRVYRDLSEIPENAKNNEAGC